MKRAIFSILFISMLPEISPALAQNRSCSIGDFQACRSCVQLEKAVDLKQPNAGSYYRGAEWNGLFESYVLNCPIIADKLIKAGANPSIGGSFGSMIITVGNKWPHNNKRINDSWAVFLLRSGASVKSPPKYPEHQTTQELLKNNVPDYPDIIMLFKK